MGRVKWSVMITAVFVVGGVFYVLANEADKALVYAVLALACAVLSQHEK